MKRMILPLFLLMAMALYLTVREDGQDGTLRADNGRWLGSEPRYRAARPAETSEPVSGVGQEMD